MWNVYMYMYNVYMYMSYWSAFSSIFCCPHAEPSGPPTSLVVLASGPSTLTVEWSAPLINADVVTEYFISCAPQNDPTNLRTTTRLRIFSAPFYNLIPDTTYDCEVIARSVYGDSRPATASATTPPRESKYIHVYMAFSFILSWW